MVPDPSSELSLTCSAASHLQRYLPINFTIDGFWRLRGKRDFAFVTFPREFSRLPDKKTRYSEAPPETEGAPFLQLSFRVGVVELSGAVKYFEDHELSSVFVVNGNYWLPLTRGEPIRLLLNFLRVPSDFEGTACQFFFQVRLHNKSGVDTQGAITLKSLPASSFTPKSLPITRSTLKRSREGTDSQEKKKVKTPTGTSEWKDTYLDDDSSGDDSLGSPSPSSSDIEEIEFTNYEEEIAAQLLLLYESNPSSPSSFSLPAPTSIVITPTAVQTQAQTVPLTMNQVVHQTLKLGKLIICEAKDSNVDLKNRLALAEEVQSLLQQWVGMMYPNQRPLTLEDVREMTEQPSPPYDMSLAYYVKVLSLHLQLKENNRGILKREHLLLPMEDVAKLLGLSLTKISREYQRGCVLTCGWILKGRKRSLRWPSRPLHVLLGHISEKILRETPSIEATLPASLASSALSQQIMVTPGMTTRSATAVQPTTTSSFPTQTQLALLASTAMDDPRPSSVSAHLINCY